jgi:hypothetical protein
VIAVRDADDTPVPVLSIGYEYDVIMVLQYQYGSTDAPVPIT